MGRHDNLVEFHLDTFATDNLDTVGHAFQGLEGLILNLEVQLGGKTDATHHTQWVITECDTRLQRSGDDTILQVGQAIKGVNQFTKTVLIQADSHRINRKVATVLIILQRTILHDRLTRIVTIALLSGSHKLHFCIVEFYLSSSEILEYREMGLASQHTFQFLSHGDTATHHNHINII